MDVYVNKVQPYLFDIKLRNEDANIFMSIFRAFSSMEEMAEHIAELADLSRITMHLTEQNVTRSITMTIQGDN